MVTVVVLAPSEPEQPDAETARMADASVRTVVEVAGTLEGATVVVLDAPAGIELPDDVEIAVHESEHTDERLALLLRERTGPVVVLRAHVPHVSSAQLHDVAGSLGGTYGDALVGLTDDDGWWALGLATPDPMAVLGVPIDADGSGRHLLDRIHGLGLAAGLVDRMVAVRRPSDLTAMADALEGTPLAELLP